MLTILSRDIHGFGQKKPRPGMERGGGLSGQRNQIGGIIAMGAGQALFLLPAGDGPGKGFAGIGLQSPMAGHAKGKGLPDFRREEGPRGFGTDEIFLDAGFPGDGAGGNGLSPAGERGGRSIAIQKTGDAIRQNGFTAGGGQFFLQIRIGAEGFAIRQQVQGRGVLRRVSPSFSR